MATRKQRQHPVTVLCSSPASQDAASSSGSRAPRAGLRLNPPVNAASHEFPLVWQGVRTEKAFSSQSRLLFCQLLASNHGRKHCCFFHLFYFQCNFFFFRFPVQWRVCEGKKNEVPALAFVKKESPAALFNISHHKSVWIGYKPKSHEQEVWSSWD